MFIDIRVQTRQRPKNLGSCSPIPLEIFHRKIWPIFFTCSINFCKHYLFFLRDYPGSPTNHEFSFRSPFGVHIARWSDSQLSLSVLYCLHYPNDFSNYTLEDSSWIEFRTHSCKPFEMLSSIRLVSVTAK